MIYYIMQQEDIEEEYQRELKRIASKQIPPNTNMHTGMTKAGKKYYTGMKKYNERMVNEAYEGKKVLEMKHIVTIADIYNNTAQLDYLERKYKFHDKNVYIAERIFAEEEVFQKAADANSKTNDYLIQFIGQYYE